MSPPRSLASPFVKRKLGDDASAEALYRDALRIREKVLEPNHMVTVGTLEQLSETCAARGNFAEALALLRRALPTREAALGPGHATRAAPRGRAWPSSSCRSPSRPTRRRLLPQGRQGCYTYSGLAQAGAGLALPIRHRPLRRHRSIRRSWNSSVSRSRGCFVPPPVHANVRRRRRSPPRWRPPR